MPVTDVRFAAICLSIFLALREKWTETKERIEPLLCRDYYCNWCFLELNSASDRAKEHIMRRNVGPPLLLSESESFFEVYMRRGSSFSPSKMSNRSDTMLPKRTSLSRTQQGTHRRSRYHAEADGAAMLPHRMHSIEALIIRIGFCGPIIL